MADKVMKKLLALVSKAQSPAHAEAIEAQIALSKERSARRQEKEDAEKAEKAAKKSAKADLANVIVFAPLGAVAGYLVGDWAHDQVVEKLGADNVATPYVVPAVGAGIDYVGYTGKGMQTDERSAITGFGIGVAGAGVKRSYTDFWSKPAA